MVSKTAIMFGVIVALASALTGVVVYTFTEKSQQPTTVIQTAMDKIV
jgi:hypothetical protein